VNPENQKLLWNIINKHPNITEYFLNKAPENKSYWFQSCIGYIYENIKHEKLSIEKLQHYNKETLIYMLSTIKKPPTNDSRNEIQFTSTKPLQQNVSKSDLLNKNFAIRQKEYEDMNEKKIPDTIDFRDKIDDEPISNMDEVLKAHLQMRENELKQYAPLPVISENKNIIDNIDNSIIQESKTKKTVSWEDSEIEILKNQLTDVLRKMEKMQEEINVLKTTKDIVNNEYKNLNNNNINNDGTI